MTTPRLICRPKSHHNFTVSIDLSTWGSLRWDDVILVYWPDGGRSRVTFKDIVSFGKLKYTDDAIPIMIVHRKWFKSGVYA